MSLNIDMWVEPLKKSLKLYFKTVTGRKWRCQEAAAHKHQVCQVITQLMISQAWTEVLTLINTNNFSSFKLL